MIARFRRLKLSRFGGCALAALVRVRDRNAFALQAAIRRFAIRGAPNDAIEGPDQQYNCQQANRDVNAAYHSH